MTSSNNEGYSTTNDHLLLFNENSCTGIVLHLIELLAKPVLWEDLNNPGYCQDYNYRLLSKSWWQAHVAEDNTYRIYWTGRSPTCAYIEPSTLCASIVGIGRYSVGYHKRNGNTKQTTDLFIYSGVLPAKYAKAMVTQSLWEYWTRIWFDLRPQNGIHVQN